MRYDVVIGGREFCSDCQAEVERCSCYPSVIGVTASGHSCAATRRGADCLCFDYVEDW